LQDKIIKNAVFAVLHFRVPQFCALLYGPSVSGPAIFGRVFRGLSDLPSRVLCVVACNSIMTIVCCYYYYYYCCVLHADATPVSDYLCTSGSDEPDIHTRTCSVPRVLPRVLSVLALSLIRNQVPCVLPGHTRTCSVPRVLPRVLPGTVCTTWSHSHLFSTACTTPCTARYVCTTWSHSHLFGTVCSAVRRFQLVSVV